MSEILQRLKPKPNELVSAHSSPISDDELDALIDWCWGVATASWERPESEDQVRVVNAQWFRKWKALAQLRKFREAAK